MVEMWADARGAKAEQNRQGCESKLVWLGKMVVVQVVRG